MGNGELYNIKDDYFQLNNLYNDTDYQDVKTSMFELLMIKALQTTDPTLP